MGLSVAPLGVLITVSTRIYTHFRPSTQTALLSLPITTRDVQLSPSWTPLPGKVGNRLAELEQSIVVLFLESFP
jgi:hypothetical protein